MGVESVTRQGAADNIDLGAYVCTCFDGMEASVVASWTAEVSAEWPTGGNPGISDLN